MTGNQVLLWDFDGTLGQRLGRWSGTVLEVLNAEHPGHNYPRDQIAAVLSPGSPGQSTSCVAFAYRGGQRSRAVGIRPWSSSQRARRAVRP